MKRKHLSTVKRITPTLLTIIALVSATATLVPHATLAQGCTPPASGLVSWWPGNGNTLDVAGANNGTLVGNAAFGTGEVSQAFTFDGHGDGVLVGNPTNLQLQTFTIEAWVKRGSVTQASLDFNGGIIFGYGHSGYGLALSDDGHALLSEIEDSAVFSTKQITDTNWHHLAVTRVSSNVVFYVDGVADLAPAYNPTFLFTTPAAVGTRGDTFANTFLGSVDEVSIYNRVLAASEIQAIFNAGSAGKCGGTPPPTCTPPPAGLVGWWPGNGNTLDAASTNNGALQGNTAFVAGEVGQAFTLDGDGDGVLIGNPASLQLQNFTIEAWLKRGSVTQASATPGGGVIFGYGTVGYALALLDDGTPALSQIDVGNVQGGQKITDTNFHHLAVTKNGSTVVFYVDGAATFTAGYGPIFQFNTSAAIGARGDTLQASFLGLIDEVSVYNRALAGSEIQTIFNAGSNGKCSGPTAPSITQQPAGQTQTIGNNASFSVIAAGSPPLAYQWRLNSNNLSGATNPVLNLANVQPADGGNYSVVVTNASGSATSLDALLTLNPATNCAPPPSGLVSWWPGNGNTLDLASSNNGALQGNVVFSAGKVGQAFALDGNGDGVLIGNPANLQLQTFTIEAWVKRGSATQSSGTPGDGIIFGYGGGGYALTLFNDGTPALSQVDFSNIQGGQRITDTAFHHLAVTKSGSTVVFYVDGTASTAPAYNPTFQFNTPAAIGARGDTFQASFLGSIDEVSIYNRALGASEIQAIYNAGSNGKCSAGVPPTITSHPISQTVPAGTNVTFSIGVTGTAPLSYQWQFNFTNLNGATNPVLNLVDVQPANDGTYSVVVTNAFGTLATGATLTVTPASACTPPASGLVSWWQAESNANDTVGGNNGTLLNGAGFAAGEVGQAFNFNGGGHVRIPDAPSLRFTTAMTVEAWVNPANTANNQQIVSKWDAVGASNQRSYGLAIYSDGHAYIGVSSDGLASGSVNVFSTNTVPVNQWTHIAATYDGAALKIYLNGVLDSSLAYSAGIFPGTDDLGIAGAVGGEPVGGVIQPFAGSVDEMSLYNRALTASEIQAVFNAGSAGKCNDVPPMITSQPTNQTVVAGANVTFSVNASGAAPLGYQWRLGGSNIGGQTNSSLSLANVQPGQSGNMYSVTVSNAFGTTNSIAALLTVNSNSNSNCTPPPSGLVSWWPGNGNTLDVAGTNNGTLVGNTAFASGEVSQAFTLDGSGDGVLIGNPPSLQLQNFTIEAWIKRGSATKASMSTSGGIIFGYGHAGYSLGVLDDGTVVLSQVDVSFVAGGQKITDTAFHHLAVTKNGSNVVFYVDGTASTAPAYNPTFQFNTAAIGIRGDNSDNSFLGLIDEVSVFNRALTASEIQAISNAGSAGKCNEVPPTITSQPANQTVPKGANATFSVGASGTAPLGYQWHFNGTNLNGATNPVLNLTNVQPTDGGTYNVVVTNPFGSAISARAFLTVTLAASALQVVSANAGGGVAVVPINLIANGRENALGFSINFDTSVLSFTGVTLGSGDAAGILLSNTTLIASGKLGLGVALPANTAFAAGTQQVVKISFTTKPVSNLTVTPISFGDQPTVRQVSDAHAVAMPATYAGGTVTIPFSFEGDVTPRPTGDGVVSITDWVEVGRFAAHLDLPMTPAEFQRADCAPRSTLGDGLLTVADWVQAGRYAIALDPLTPAGGPTGPGAPSPITVSQEGLNAAGNRTLTVASADAQAGQACDVSIQLNSAGNENALGFNLIFDPSVLSFTGASLGSGATGAVLNVNDQQAGAGTIGLALALPTGSAFAAQSQEVVRLHFVVASSAAGNTVISFAGQPVTPEVVDAAATPMTTTYVNGKLAIVSQNGSPLLTFTQTDSGLALSWPASASEFNLESSGSLSSPNWSGVSLTPVTNATDITVTIPLSNGQAFYRLRHP